MKRTNTINWGSAGLMIAAGVSVLTGCRTSEIDAITTGVGVLSDTLVSLDHNNNSSTLRDLGDLGGLLLNAFGN